MSETFQCGDTAALVGYLYDECEAEERLDIAAHVTVCPACAAELAALESTREQLASWAPPEATLGFQITRPDTTVARPVGIAERTSTRTLEPAVTPAPWWRQPIPAWAQAAAALLIFAAGVSIGVARSAAVNGSSLSGASAVAPAIEAPVTATATPAPASSEAAVATVSPQDLAALEERLRAEIVAARAASSPAPGPRAVNTSGASVADLEALEQRLQAEMALRLTQLARDFEMQRRVDLARISQELGPFNAEIMRQRQELNNVNNLIRTSLQGR